MIAKVEGAGERARARFGRARCRFPLSDDEGAGQRRPVLVDDRVVLIHDRESIALGLDAGVQVHPGWYKDVPDTQE